jgi:hypothetical protein
MSWGSCCSMLSYCMCWRFLFMLWCPGVHVVQCCLITCVHIFCSSCDVLGFIWTKNVNTCNKTTLNNTNPRTSQHEQKTWTHVIRQHWTTWTPGHHNMNKKRERCPGVHVVQCCLITCDHVFCSCCDVLGFILFNVVLLHVFTLFVHVVMSRGSWTKNVNTCNKTTLKNMNPRKSQHEQKTWIHVIRQHWTTRTPGHHHMNKKRGVHVFCSCCAVLGFVLFNVVLLHVFTFFVHVVMSWGSCCSMLSYYMCSRFLFMLWYPGVHVVQCCLITNIEQHEPQDITTWTKNVNTCNKTTLNNMNPRTSQHEQKTWTHVIRQHWTTSCLITCVHVFCSCCDVLGFMLFNVVLLHVFTFFVHVVMSWGSCCSMLSYYKNVNTCNKTTLNNMNPWTSQHEQKTWTHVIRQHWTTWTPGHHKMK